MESFVLNATEDTPKVLLNLEESTFEFSGKSYPEDANHFYEPIKRWFWQYIEMPLEITIIDCKIEYFNSSSTRKFLDVFYILEKLRKKEINKKPVKVCIKWHYEKGDRLMKTKGMEYQRILKIPVELVEVAN